MDIKYADSLEYTFTKDEAGTYYSPWFDISWANEIYAYKTITFGETRTGDETEILTVERNTPSSIFESINTCDATADWAPSVGAELSIDTSDKMEGTGSLVATTAEPETATNYSTTYNPTGTWDWSAKKHLLFWLKCDRASGAFTTARFFIFEGANYRYWNLTFSANTWTPFNLLLSTGDAESGSPNFALITHIVIQFKATDTDAFYKKIDDVRFSESTLFIFTPRTATHAGEEKHGSEGYGHTAPNTENKLGTKVRFKLVLGGTSWTSSQEYTVVCSMYAKRN